MKENIDIVLASYNGGLYLKEQVDSIIKQCPEGYIFNVIISDDGSDKESIDIILDLIKTYKNVILLKNSPKNKGVIGNFNNALECCKSEYIFFSDQDDYWIDGKFSLLLNEIKLIDNNHDIPALIFSDMSITDQYLNITSESFYKSKNINPKNNLDIRFLQWKSTVYGCTILINRRLLEISGPTPRNYHMHDHWLVLNALKHGKVKYVDRPLNLYRQHNKNVVGAGSSSLLSKIKRCKKTVRSINNSSRITYLFMKNEGTEVTKISFIRDNISPFFRENVMYNILFIFLFLVKK